MAANTHSSHAHDIFCPDPSAHDKSDGGLSAQASTAALYVTQPHKGTDSRDVLDKDGKLSSRSAAASLKYAKPTDLPSFPSHGGDPNAAGAAAMLAKDYKMKDLWQPEQSMAGSKAALKAQKDGAKLDLWQYEGSKNGLSAAALAMRKNTQTPLSPNIDRGYTDLGKNNSLLAATKSTNSSRQRADSTPGRPPPQYPDEQNSARNALNAATVSHRNSVRYQPAKKEEGWSSEANQAARIKNSHMDKEMFGSAPPVEPELEERKREAALRASAVSMAKKMYDVQNRARLANPPDDTSSILSGETAHKRNTSSMSQSDLKQEAMRYITLQDQAHKLAQERLAKVDKDMENSKYREYYGYGNKSPRKSRLSVRGRTRNRAASEGAASDDSDDEEQARRIRRQMSQLNTASTTVSDNQRAEDRARLLKAAEKRVHDRMHDMDEKVFYETGKPTQAMIDEWDRQAREKAEKDRAEREKHPGKTHIGGGKYMDQSEIEAIAAARLKPTLDELGDNATKRREREAEIARQRDAAQTERMEEKMRNEQQKAEFKRIKEQDKAAARKEKEERKAAQREEKARKSEDKRKSREVKRESAGAVAGGAALGEVAQKVKDDDKDDEAAAEEQQEDSKDKRKSLFGRFTDKFRKDEKPAHQDEKATGQTVEDNDKEGASAVLGASTVGATGAAAPAAEDDSLYDVSAKDAEGAREVDTTRGVSTPVVERRDDLGEDTSHSGLAAGAAAGAAGAGGLAWATSRSDRNPEDGDVSSVSSDAGDRDLQKVETAHSALPLQSPAVEFRPDLERHISRIGTSSGEESGSELSDSDEEDDARGRQPSQGQGQGYFLATSLSEPAPAAAKEPVAPLREEQNTAEKEHISVPVLVPQPKEKEDDVVPTTEDKTGSAPARSTETAEPAAAAPIVAGGPSVAEANARHPAAPKDTGKAGDDKDEKEKRGFRGLISRLKGRDKDNKSDGKLHKNRSSSEQAAPSEKSFQGGAKFNSPQQESNEPAGDESVITPVTTTSAAKEAEAGAGTTTGTVDPGDNKPLPLHIGTDGVIGDPRGRVASAENDTAGSAASISSFKRHDAPLRDPDEVSSSGAEEDDVQRGRAGRFARKLGLGGRRRDHDHDHEGGEQGNKAAEPERESEEQFEEARDTFDESLAPPAAFAGQLKSQSPVRETKFTENL